MSDPAVSFEFFPPGDEAMAQQLWQSVQRLAPLRPEFCVGDLWRGRIDPDPHARIRATRAEGNRSAGRAAFDLRRRRRARRCCELRRTYWQLGVRHLVALRGDAPAANLSADGRYLPYPGGFAYASDLVRGLSEAGDFEISVAAYPEGHPESGGVDADLENLQRKVDAGARRAITQFFFDTDLFLRYRDRCAAAGIKASIVPGSCRSRASRNCCASPRVAAPRFRIGCAVDSTAWMTIPIPAA